MLQNTLKTSFSILKNGRSVQKVISQSFSGAETLTPIKLAFATYETTNLSLKEPPFVILHGLFGSKQNWSSLCKAYHQKASPQRKIIALDLRNHGDSPHSEEHSYAHLAVDIKQFLSDHGIAKIVLMGHSMGGRTAMLFALKYPELVGSLIIVDISPVTTSPHLGQMPTILNTMLGVKIPNDVPMSKARVIADGQLAKHIPAKYLRDFLLTNLIQNVDKSYDWRVNIRVLLKNFNNVARFPSITGMQYKGPTLFIGGGNSDFIGELFKPTNFLKYVRTKTDFSAKREKFKSVMDLAYASYQGTESVLKDVKEIPTPLVILHGILGCKSNFNTLCKRYHESTTPKRLVYAIDFRNHGDSAHSKDHSYDNLVMDILKFCDTMDLKKVSLIGHDMGGRVGMLFSLKYPEYIDKLIVTDISPITTSHSFKTIPEILKTLKNINFPPNLAFQHARAYVANQLSTVIKNKGLMTFVLMNLVPRSEGSYSWRFNIKALLENFNELSSFPEIHNIKFDGPVLFIGGGKSDYIQKSDYPKIQKLFPNAELKYIEGAGHWVHSEKPQEFLKLTLNFLNRNVTSVN